MTKNKTFLKSKEVLFDQKIEKLRWLVRIRYVAPVAIWLAVVLTSFPAAFTSPSFYIYTPITILFLIVNVFIDFYLRNIQSLPSKEKTRMDLNSSILIQVLFDIMLFTILIYFDGTLESPIMLLYMFVILTVGFLADKVYGYVTVGIISILYSMLVIGELVGVLEHVYVRGEGSNYFFVPEIALSDLGAIVVSFFLILYFIHFLSGESKELENEMDNLLVENEKIKEQYQDITDNAYDFIQSIDAYGSFLYVNKVWKKRLGYTDEDVEIIKVFDVITEKDILGYKRALEKLKVSGENQEFQITLITKFDEEIIVDATLSAKFDEKGNVISTREIFRDVTKAVAVKMESEAKKQELEALNQTMVGREMRIIELQEQVEFLEQQLKKKRDKES